MLRTWLQSRLGSGRAITRPTRRVVHPLYAVVAITLVAGAALAAVTIAYTTSSSTSLQLKAAPVVWVAGPDATGNAFVASWTLSSNGTYYSATLKPVPESTVTWGNFTTLRNQASEAYDVTVSATNASAYAKVLVLRMQFYTYGTNTLVGTLDLKDASPSAALGTMAAGTSWYAKFTIQLDTGAGAADLPPSVGVSLALTPV